VTYRKHDKPEELDDRLVATLAEALTPVTPDAEARARMRNEILLHAGAGETAVIRAGEGEWREFLPGIRIKTLRLDREQGTQSSLWRLEPGARIPGHAHTREEECLVLEGSVIHRDQTYRAGDYVYAPSGVRHDEFRTEEGALLYIRSQLVPRTNRLTRFLYRLFFR